MWSETEESFRFFTLADFSSLYRLDKEGLLKDLKDYFGVDLHACECRCKGSGVGLCSLVKPRPDSDKGDT